ncbi:MAG: hypothetical protein COB08_018730 [Rhodobacteraceae bacterium]|nr:hypothetical protein [Paracoccaceae bacterium]
MADIYVYLGMELGLSHLLKPEILPKHGAQALPEKAPEMFQKRDNRSEKPHEFINRVYKCWLGKGLAQNHILNLDKPLYHALHNWIQRNTFPTNLDLPSKKEVSDLELATLGLQDGGTLPCPSFQNDLKDQIRLYYAARNRAKKDKKTKD